MSHFINKNKAFPSTQTIIAKICSLNDDDILLGLYCSSSRGYLYLRHTTITKSKRRWCKSGEHCSTIGATDDFRGD